MTKPDRSHTRAHLVVVAFENNLADPNLLPT